MSSGSNGQVRREPPNEVHWGISPSKPIVWKKPRRPPSDDEEELVEDLNGIELDEDEEPKIDPTPVSDNSLAPQLQNLNITNHKEKNKQRLRICWYWLRGECRNGANCRFAHPSPNDPPIDRKPKPPPVCKFFVRGICRNGDACRWSHNLPEKDSSKPNPVVPPDKEKKQTKNKKKICSLWLDGKCNNGDACPLAHPPLKDPQKQKPEIKVKLHDLSEFDDTADKVLAAHEHLLHHPPSKKVCKHFEVGECPRGDKCRFSHKYEDLNHQRFNKALFMSIWRRKQAVLMEPPSDH